MSDRDFDLVLFGATGYAGRLTAEHVATSAPPGTSIALAGRDETKLHRIRDAIGAAAESWKIVVADITDGDSIRRLAESTTAVATTVGPYAKYGMPLVAACASAGTHYADLTGEVMFVRDAIDAHHGTAENSGARIVNACGFDSVPSDIGVHELHRTAVAAGHGRLTDTALVVTDLRGGVSGGTFASLSGQIAAMRNSSAVRKLVIDPYSLSPDRAAEPDRQVTGWGAERDPMMVTHDSVTGRWLAPFVMAAYNTRIVRRSNALLGHAYGRQFRYTEWLGLGHGVAGLGIAAAATVGTAAITAALLPRPTRDLIERRMPKPGEGPSAETRAKGRFTCELHAKTADGALVTATVSAKGDPGYAATAVMFGEAALALALDGDALPDAAGVLTPATAIGDRLTARLRLHEFTITSAVA